MYVFIFLEIYLPNKNLHAIRAKLLQDISFKASYKIPSNMVFKYI